MSWRAEELLNIALLSVQNLFYLPSLSLKIGLCLGFFFPSLVSALSLGFVPGRCWWRIFCVRIWLLGLFGVRPWGVHPPFLFCSSPALCSGVTWQGLCLLPPVDLYELAGEDCCAVQSLSLSLSPVWGTEFVFSRKADVQGCEFFFTFSRALCVSGTEKLQLWSY